MNTMEWQHYEDSINVKENKSNSHRTKHHQLQKLKTIHHQPATAATRSRPAGEQPLNHSL